MNKILVFVSPTCGPCQLFKPQLRKAALETQSDYDEIDVSTEEGLEEAKKYNIQSSGQAIFFKDGEEKIRWISPKPANILVADINKL
jgi:thiol-disulfide isomerase/thioredoxin